MTVHRKPRVVRMGKCLGCGKEYEIGCGSRGVVCSRECYWAIRATHYRHSAHSKGKGGKRADLDNVYFRSRWEANWARYLNWLVAAGEVLRWEFEPDTFEFAGIRRGSRFYTPDFKVTNRNGSVEYHEIKGYMTDADRTKLRRMKKYHPAVKVIVVGPNEYKAVAKKMAGVLPNWERGAGKGPFM
jgi:hypothetical protein